MMIEEREREIWKQSQSEAVYFQLTPCVWALGELILSSREGFELNYGLQFNGGLLKQQTQIV